MDLQQLMKKLSQAVRENNSESALEILVKNPELLKHPDNVKNGSELLGYAISRHYEEIIELLIQFVEHVSLTYCLEVAVYQENFHAVECLLKNGVKPEDQNSLVVYLLTTKLQNLHPENLCMPTETSSADTKKKILILFAQNGLIYAEFRNENGHNFLWILFRNFLLEEPEDKDYNVAMEMADILINSGISVEDLDNIGFTLLISAIRKDILWIEYLVKKGADVNRKIQHDYIFPLLIASDDAATVDLLLSKGADINAKNTIGCTALLLACSCHCYSVISLLLKEGADISVRNSNGNTPFSTLKPSEDNYERCLEAIVKVFSLLIFENKAVPKDYWDLLSTKPLAQEIHDKCMGELVQMSEKIFYAPFTYYRVLKMKSTKRLALLLMNDDFEKSFESNLSLFAFYKDDLQKLFDVATKVRDDLIIVQSRLKNVFGNYLPELVIKKLSESLSMKDLPLK